MRYVRETRRYRRQFKRACRGEYSRIIDERLPHVIQTLAKDEELDYSYHDHALSGNWEGYRECHIAFDLLLVYRYEDFNVLLLEGLGSHSEILGL